MANHKKDLSEILLREYDGYCEKVKIDKTCRYKWRLSLKNCPVEIPPKYKDNYDKNLYLKEALKDKFGKPGNKQFFDTAFWAINTWGGIHGFDREKNESKVLNFIQKMDKVKGKLDYITKIDRINLLSTDEAEVISSLSKVASFYSPDDFVIYDYRVVFSLNWFIYKNNINCKFFPTRSNSPKDTRSKTLKKYNQKKDFYEESGRKPEYYSKEVAYLEYCSLLNKTAAKRVGLKNYDLEMFLFANAIDKDFLKELDEEKERLYKK